METLRIGFVGLGGICRQRHVPGLKKLPGIELRAVANRTRESSEKAAREFGIPVVCDSWQELVARDDIDIVFVGTWPYLHREVSVAALESGKHVFCQARMAMDYRQRLGKKAAWVCADTLRTGAIGEARAYTDALDLPLRLVYTPQDLSAALAGLDDVDLVLIDTPGYNPYREQEIVELGGLLSELPERALYLVVPANIKEGDLFCMSGALSVFGLDGVIVTKLDETSTYGGVYNFVRKSRLPLAYFTFGKAASAGLEAATSQRLVAALFGKGWNQ
uniref:SRP54-type proteins GTP-binding domain-containing protein n=1 Tax=Anaerolinea thermolimosa TaxID=229919 RepID=A0A7C4PK83_9CHLR